MKLLGVGIGAFWALLQQWGTLTPQEVSVGHHPPWSFGAGALGSLNLGD